LRLFLHFALKIWQTANPEMPETAYFATIYCGMKLALFSLELIFQDDGF
jgi:hypothetical protein